MFKKEFNHAFQEIKIKKVETRIELLKAKSYSACIIIIKGTLFK